MLGTQKSKGQKRTQKRHTISTLSREILEIKATIETNSPNKTALTIFSTGKTYLHISEILLYIVCD